MDLVDAFIKPFEPVLYPIIRVSMSALRSWTYVVRGTNSMMIHVGGALLNPILSALPKNNNQITYEDPVVDDTLPHVSLYDDMNTMLNASAIIYVYIRLRNEAKKSLYGNVPGVEGDGFQIRYKNLKKQDMKDLENQYKLVKDIQMKIDQATNKEDLVELKVKYFDAQRDLKELFKAKAPAVDELEMADVEHQFDLLSLPKTGDDILRDFKKDGSRIKAFIELFGGEDFYSKEIETLRKTDGALLCVDDDFSSTELFGDKTELTWAIVINHTKKRIAVIFRGSCVMEDFIVDATLNSSPFLVDGPDSKAPPLGRVHTGFYKYLYDKTQIGSDGRDISKSEAIMGKLHELFGIYKDYTLYVTGHSLGAALSTLFAFRAADNALIPKPVINVSFASPFVGDQKFRDEFQKREILGLIRHIRVSNEDDIVPLVPFTTLSIPPMLYKHTGLNVRLYNPTWWRNINYEVSFPKNDDILDEVVRAAKNNIFLGIEANTLFNHLCPEYRSRLDGSAELLKKLHLETMYRDPTYTGDIANAINDTQSEIARRLLAR